MSSALETPADMTICPDIGLINLTQLLTSPDEHVNPEAGRGVEIYRALLPFAGAPILLSAQRVTAPSGQGYALRCPLSFPPFSAWPPGAEAGGQGCSPA